MKLDNRTMRLIAVGASIAANCQPCLEANLSRALDCGAGAQEISEAIGIGKLVRQGAASKMDRYVLTLAGAATASPADKDGCGCGSLPVRMPEAHNG
jgi:AhpD family alkylhydroperoxidase